MPYPAKNESRSQYISRAIPIFMQEGYSQKVALGRAYGFWKSYSGKNPKTAIPVQKK